MQSLLKNISLVDWSFNFNVTKFPIDWFEYSICWLNLYSLKNSFISFVPSFSRYLLRTIFLSEFDIILWDASKYTEFDKNSNHFFKIL